MNFQSKKPSRFCCNATSVVACAAVFVFPLRALAQELDSLRYGAGATYTYDSNLFRTDKDTPAQIAPRGVAHDQVMNVYALLGFDKTWSRQRFIGDFTIGTSRYNDFSEFNHDTQKIRAGWRGSFPGNIALGLMWNRTMDQANFADYAVPRKNVLTQDTLSPDFDLPIVSNWHVIGGAAAIRRRNSNELDQRDNSDGTSVNGGIRYRSGYGNTLDLVYTSGKTTYPNIDAGVALDNAYREQRGDLRVQWAFSGTSVLSGNVGYVKRNHDTLQDRDFSGPSYQLNYDWQSGGSTRIGSSIYRTLGAAGDNDYDYAITTGIRISPSWEVTEKLQLGGGVEWYKRDYLGSIYSDIPQLVALYPDRKDRAFKGYASVSWQALRILKLSAQYTGSHRNSTRLYQTYTDHLFALTGEMSF